MNTEHRCLISRRRFLKAAGGCVAGLWVLPLAEPLLAAPGPVSRTPIFAKPKAKVTLVFTHVPSGVPTWPTKDYDYDSRARTLAAKLKEACPGIRFDLRTALNAAEADAIVKDTPETDGYLVYLLGIWTWACNAFSHSGKPVVMVDDLYAGSGEMLLATGAARREKLPMVSVSSSDFQDVVNAARLFEVLSSMKASTILDVTDGNLADPFARVKTVYGTKVVQLGSKELADRYSATDEREAAEWADLWMKGARKVVEPTRDEMIKSGRMYLALSRAAAEKHADAVTMNCLGMFYSGAAVAYPCFSHFQMNNDGGTGVCEGDLNSTCTQLMIRYLTGRPGYVSDPVIDTSTNEIIYAHCVSTNHVFGPKGRANPYLVRSHAEDGKGASVQSLMPVNEPVTTLETDVWSKRMVIHTGKTSRNLDESKACRTKLAAKVNAEKILNNWDMGWHRVTVYGDWRKQFMDLARLMGFEVLEEDRA